MWESFPYRTIEKKEWVSRLGRNRRRYVPDLIGGNRVICFRKNKIPWDSEVGIAFGWPSRHRNRRLCGSSPTILTKHTRGIWLCGELVLPLMVSLLPVDVKITGFYMVVIVLMVSTSVCGTGSVSSNLTYHPKLRYVFNYGDGCSSLDLWNVSGQETLNLPRGRG